MEQMYEDMLKNISWKRTYNRNNRNYEVMIHYTEPNSSQKHGRLTIRFDKDHTPIDKFIRCEVSVLSADSNVIVFEFIEEEANDKKARGYALSATPNGKMIQPVLMPDEVEAYNKIWRNSDFYRLYHMGGPYYFIKAPEV